MKWVNSKEIYVDFLLNQPIAGLHCEIDTKILFYVDS
jgi:hypothetical protein